MENILRFSSLINDKRSIVNGESQQANLTDIDQSVDRLTEWQYRLIPFTADRYQIRVHRIRSNIEEAKLRIETVDNQWQTTSMVKKANQQITFNENDVDQISDSHIAEEADIFSSSSSSVAIIPLAEENNENFDHNDDEQTLMHHFALIERFLRQREFLKNRIDELSQWIESIDEKRIFEEKFSLERTKLDEQIVKFRYFYAQLRTYREIFDKDVKTRSQINQLVDDEDLQRINDLEDFLDKNQNKAKIFNEKFEKISRLLNRFHVEHVRLIEHYGKSIRSFSELIEKNDDLQFTDLIVLLKEEQTVDHRIYETIRDELLELDSIKDEEIIEEEDERLDEYRDEYEKFRDDFKSILQNRQEIFNEFDLMKNQIEDWLFNAENLLKHSITLDLCRQLLVEHSSLPIDSFQTLAEQLIRFYSSANLLNLYERLKLVQPTNQSQMTQIFREQTDEIVEAHRTMKIRLLNLIEFLENIQMKTNQYEVERINAEETIKKAKNLVRFGENLTLPLDQAEMKILREKYQKIGNELRSMLSTIEQYKTNAMNFIEYAEQFIDKSSIEEEIKTIEKSWSTYVEFLFDTLDLIEMHDEDLTEFYQMAHRFLQQSDDQIDKLAEQIELIDQKGEFLLQNSTNSNGENPVSQLLDTIHENYENLMKKIFNSTETQQKNLEEISAILVATMNEIPSCRTTKLIERFDQIKSIRHELDRIVSEIEIIRDRVLDDENNSFEEKFRQLIEHATIMRQSNDLREDQLLLIQTLVERFSSSHQHFIDFTHRMFNELSQIIPDGNLDDEQMKFEQLVRTISHERKSFQTFLTEETAQLLTLIATNREESDEIHQKLDQIKRLWNRLENEEKLCKKRLNDANFTSKIVNEKIREQKTLIYEQMIHPNLLNELVSALDKCSTRFSQLNNEAEPKERKAMAMLLGKFRLLLNEIQMISFDLEQLKENSEENPETINKVNQRWEKLFNEVKEKFDRLRSKQQFIEDIVVQLDQIDDELSKCSIYTKFSPLIERLEQLAQQIEPKKTQAELIEYFQRFVELYQRAKNQNEKFTQLKQSLDLFDRSAVKFTEWLTETERYLNSRKTISRRFGLLDVLLKQIDEHQTIEKQLELWKNSFVTLSQLATNLISNLSKFDSIRIRHSFNSMESRWQRVSIRINERHKDLQRALENAKKMIQPKTEDIDRIRSEVNRQTSLCQCLKKYDVEQIGEGRYRFGETQSLRLVRILRSTVMVRVGGGWTSLDEYLTRHDPCRAKGRTNLELHPDVYALREGVAQTMSMIKSKLSNNQRSFCLAHPMAPSQIPTPIRIKPNDHGSSLQPSKERSRVSLSSNGDLSISADDLSFTSQLISENELKPSRIPIPIAMSTPAPSIISRTSSRESLLSEQSISSSMSSMSQRKASKLPIAVSRQKKMSNGKNSSSQH